MNITIALHANPHLMDSTLTAIGDLAVSVDRWAPPRANVVIDEANHDAVLALLDPAMKVS